MSQEIGLCQEKSHPLPFQPLFPFSPFVHRSLLSRFRQVERRVTVTRCLVGNRRRKRSLDRNDIFLTEKMILVSLSSFAPTSNRKKKPFYFANFNVSIEESWRQYRRKNDTSRLVSFGWPCSRNGSTFETVGGVVDNLAPPLPEYT